MSTVHIREPSSFGKKNEPHKVVLVRNGKTRTFNVNPLFVSVGMCFAFVIMIGYLSATAYLVFRDDLIESSFAQKARMQHEYEDRIASLRAKLDRVTSRQLLDQQQIELRVSELMKRQASIGERTGKFGTLLERAKKSGLSVTKSSGAIPVPQISPQKQASITDTITTGSIDPKKPVNTARMALALTTLGTENTSHDIDEDLPKKSSMLMAFNNRPAEINDTGEIFGEIAQAIDVINASQRTEMDNIRIAAAERTQKIAKLLKSVGASFSKDSSTDIGGPFQPLDHSVNFEVHLHALEDTLERYDRVAGVAKALPLHNPVPGAKVSSRFGSRVDPFNGRRAMHSGIDFKAPRGTPVLATGGGKVIKAGRKGGYGKVVEIKHVDGIITRYAHLSRISVKKGQRVNAGQRIGKVGSTGRSTGPHLHYEVRRNGKARNPSTFLKTGSKLRGLL